MGRKSKTNLQEQLFLTRKEIEECLPEQIEPLNDKQVYKISSSIYEFTKLIYDNFNVKN
ncbi:MAG: hypothetical protein ACJASR_002607 [Psychroserpens sp.]|jgi:hypothetical protein